MSDDFIAWLYDKARKLVCVAEWDCADCAFYDPTDPKRDCTKLTADQKREILMKIYESEVDTNASNN